MILEAETATAGSSEGDVHMTPKSTQRVDAALPENREREYVRHYAVQYLYVADTMTSTKQRGHRFSRVVGERLAELNASQLLTRATT
jgi:hypothetical protein